jgi:peptidoglycan/LPS O-acetylase OafA/YrhL
VYLWHVPILLFWNRLRVLDGHVASLPAYLFVLGVVAWLSWRWIERPFLARDSNPRPL